MCTELSLDWSHASCSKPGNQHLLPHFQMRRLEFIENDQLAQCHIATLWFTSWILNLGPSKSVSSTVTYSFGVIHKNSSTIMNILSDNFYLALKDTQIHFRKCMIHFFLQISIVWTWPLNSSPVFPNSPLESLIWFLLLF